MRERIRYVAYDGLEFDDKKECEMYDSTLKQSEYFIVNHLSKGTFYFRILSDVFQSDYVNRLLLEDYISIDLGWRKAGFHKPYNNWTNMWHVSSPQSVLAMKGHEKDIHELEFKNDKLVKLDKRK